MTLESILAILAAESFQIGSLSQSPRGWEVTLWSGPVGYSNYTCATASSPAIALTTALSDLRNTGGKPLECNEVIDKAEIRSALDSILARLAPPSEPIKRRI